MTMTSDARRICAIAAVLSCPAAAVAEAPAGWSEPTVAHSGIRVMSADGETVQSRFHWVTEHWIPVTSRKSGCATTTASGSRWRSMS